MKKTLVCLVLGFLPACSSVNESHRAPRTLKSQVESFTAIVSINPASPVFAGSKAHFRSVTLHVPMLRFEPDALSIDGKPVSGSARISPAEAQALINLLTRHDFFTKAQKSYSERKAPHRDFPPPENAVPHKQRKDLHHDAPLTVRLTVHDEHWYTNYEGGFPIDGGNDGSGQLGNIFTGESRELVLQLQP